MDAYIDLPKADQVPSVKAALAGPMSLPIRGKFETATPDIENGISLRARRDNNVISVDAGFRGVSGIFDTDTKAGAQAEFSPLTSEQAHALALSVIAPLIEAGEGYELALGSQVAHSRTYKNVGTLSRPVPDYGSPMTKMGWYELSFIQRFYGVPFLSQLPFASPPKGIPGSSPISVYAVIGSQQDYYIGFHPLVAVEVIDQALPLAPFTEVKAEAERLIEAGYAAEVYGMTFGIMSFFNQEDQGKTFVLVPVWEVRGEFVEEPGLPFPDMPAERQEHDRRFGGMNIYINAQTAQYIDPVSQDPDRAWADIITWQEVRGT